jgi:hypothetical protein
MRPVCQLGKSLSSAFPRAVTRKRFQSRDGRLHRIAGPAFDDEITHLDRFELGFRLLVTSCEPLVARFAAFAPRRLALAWCEVDH